MRVSFTHKGNFEKTEAFLKKVGQLDVRKLAQPGAQRGVKALAAATPRESGRAANAWAVEVIGAGKAITIHWLNRDIENGFAVAVALQYGYGTGTGGYVPGRDYINPAMKPIFDQIANDVWKAVKSA